MIHWLGAKLNAKMMETAIPNGDLPVMMFSIICHHCGAIFPNVESFQNHYHIVHQVKDQEDLISLGDAPQCHECQLVFAHEAILARHKTKVHPAPTNNDITHPVPANSVDLTNNDINTLDKEEVPNNKSEDAAAERLNAKDSNVLPFLKVLSGKIGELAYCPHCGVKIAANDSFANHLMNVHGENADAIKREAEGLNGDAQTDESDLLVPKVELQAGDEYEDDDDYKPEFMAYDDELEEEYPRKRGRKRKALDIKSGSWLCDYCSEDMGTPTYLKHHIIDEHEEEMQEVECQDCNKTFVSITLLNHHLKSHFKKRKCKICSDVLNSLKELKTHMADEHPNEAKTPKYPYKCSQCDYRSSVEKRLINHISTTHDPESSEYACPKCDKMFRSRRQLTEHDKKVHVQADAICPYCGKVVKEYLLPRHLKVEHHGQVKECFFCDFKGNSLHRHLKEMHPIPEVSFPCGACDKVFEDADSLESHQKHNHDETEKCRVCHYFVPVKDLARHLSAAHDEGYTERCEFCDFESTLGVMARHVQKVHLKDECRFRRNCPYCDVKVINQKYKRHIYLVHPEKVEKFVCDDCGKTYECKKALELHIEVHKQGGYQICEVCSKKVIKKRMNHHLSLYHDIGLVKKCKHCDFKSTYGELTKHVYENHNHKVECDICHKTFKATCLRQHVRQAHVIGRMKCEHCDQTFVTRTSRDRHIKNMHKKEEYAKKCPHCEYRSVDLGRLKTHILAHEGIKPHKCKLCDYQVIWKRHLTNHLRKKHGICK